jgi:hypothetical protein
LAGKSRPSLLWARRRSDDLDDVADAGGAGPARLSSVAGLGGDDGVWQATSASNVTAATDTASPREGERQRRVMGHVGHIHAPVTTGTLIQVQNRHRPPGKDAAKWLNRHAILRRVLRYTGQGRWTPGHDESDFQRTNSIAVAAVVAVAGR